MSDRFHIPKELIERDQLLSLLTDAERDNLLPYLAYLGLEIRDPNYPAFIAVYSLHCLACRTLDELSGLPKELVEQQQKVATVHSEIISATAMLKQLCKQMQHLHQQVNPVESQDDVAQTTSSSEEYIKSNHNQFWLGIFIGTSSSFFAGLALTLLLAILSELPESNQSYQLRQEIIHEVEMAKVAKINRDGWCRNVLQ